MELSQSMGLGLYIKEEAPPGLHPVLYSLVALIFKLSRFGSCCQSRYQKPIWQLSVRTIHVSEHRPSDNLIYLDVQVSCWINSE